MYNKILKIILFVLLLISFSLLAWSCAKSSGQNSKITVASKKFTESVILGEIISQFIKYNGVEVKYQSELGGTRILWNALLNGDIDIYPEYTGTITQEIFSGKKFNSFEDLGQHLKKMGVIMSSPLGFNNTYALGMKKEIAERYNINKISDLIEYPSLSFAFTNEFMDRTDGWRSLKKKYNLPQKDVKGVDHDLAYRGLDKGAVQLIDLYSTDAEIRYYNIKTLKDDLHFFNDYKAVILYRKDIGKRFPTLPGKFAQLESTIPESLMVAMNASVKLEHTHTEKTAASEFLKEKLGINSEISDDSFWERLVHNTADHLILVIISLSAAVIFAIPLGLFSFRNKKFGKIILGVVGIIQTIPSLALLVFMIPLFGIGAQPAIIALFLYSLLPIVRNTYLGFENIPVEIIESAHVLGLPSNTVLRKIELPMAARSILAGIKTSAVINIGTATLGALIGAGGYGQPILTGIRLDSVQLILEGAVPAAMLALIVQWMFDGLELFIVPKGLRINSK